ncbi:hypothetical protein LPTSP1_21360 [Leptospira johnsonii]|uniref:Uncharacterized protein n=1 Tax=Leptospira johnsonii TaxID=1917820 RepID=A0A2P2D3B1_9LEPT|nr:hypothetical protein LPTSP1_21360 [Leptospira johnsonii]
MKKNDETHRNVGTKTGGRKKIANPRGAKLKKDRGKSEPVFLPGKFRSKMKEKVPNQTGPETISQPGIFAR